jgi:hypothetical protein
VPCRARSRSIGTVPCSGEDPVMTRTASRTGDRLDSIALRGGYSRAKRDCLRRVRALFAPAPLRWGCSSYPSRLWMPVTGPRAGRGTRPSNRREQTGSSTSSCGATGDEIGRELRANHDPRSLVRDLAVDLAPHEGRRPRVGRLEKASARDLGVDPLVAESTGVHVLVRPGGVIRAAREQRHASASTPLLTVSAESVARSRAGKGSAGRRIG